MSSHPASATRTYPRRATNPIGAVDAASACSCARLSGSSVRVSKVQHEKLKIRGSLSPVRLLLDHSGSAILRRTTRRCSVVFSSNQNSCRRLCFGGRFCCDSFFSLDSLVPLVAFGVYVNRGPDHLRFLGVVHSLAPS